MNMSSLLREQSKGNLAYQIKPHENENSTVFYMQNQ